MSSRTSRPSRKASDIACVFVHAGAGYHSKENELHHLQACADACKAAMSILRAGGSAVDAVELAIRVLEDREITNAGFGSNLGFDGIVECDAIVIDHRGQSGACAAVSQVKNPVSLARLILDHSTKTLSLRRVPPNLLAAEGATQFARQHAIPILPYDAMISKFTRHRWQKWRADLDKTLRHKRAVDHSHFDTTDPFVNELEIRERHRSDHSDRMTQQALIPQAQALFNDAQPISPPPTSEGVGVASGDGGPETDPEELITDTVGAIAIDNYGNIACAASSGGIGMKHRGRVGPAALAGAGATVVPIHKHDGEKVCVATVTSGTGEHIATTRASDRCSENIYHNQSTGKDGRREHDVMEETVLRNFIQHDFMGHPSVKDSDSTGAIGLLTVKATKDGAYFFYAHNTDSFALASMHSDEAQPVCTMSRGTGGSIAQGGRRLRYRSRS